MTEKQKMSGMTASEKKSHHGTAGGMDKMSNQEKADMFDKMPMATKMAVMNGGSTMQNSPKKMDK